MTADLEARIRLVEDIEAIKRLKAKYWLCVDQKLYDEMVSLFAEDAWVEIVDTHVQRRGNRVIVEGQKAFLGRPEITTVHHGYCIDLQVRGDVAEGKWAFNDIIVGREKNSVYKSWGYYDDEYRREAHGWVVTKSTITRHYVESTRVMQLG